MFSNFARVWGWATWRSSWAHYNQIEKQPCSFFEKYEDGLRVQENSGLCYFEKKYNEFFEQKPLIWDFRWAFSVTSIEGLCVIPVGNLITNIGDYDGAHVDSKDTRLNAPFVPLEWPLVHRTEEFLLDKEVDAHAMDSIFVPDPMYQLGFWKKLMRSFRKRTHALKVVVQRLFFL